MLALEQVSVIKDLKGNERIQEQRKSNQETIVQRLNRVPVPPQGKYTQSDTYVFRFSGNKSPHPREDGKIVLAFSDPLDFNQLKLGLR